jgi:hypothetical protein
VLQPPHDSEEHHTNPLAGGDGRRSRSIALGRADAAHAMRCPSWSDEMRAGRQTILARTMNTSQ